jgi:hypothetical protein
MTIVIVIQWTPDHSAAGAMSNRNHAFRFLPSLPKLANSSALPHPQVVWCLEEKRQIVVETKSKGRVCENCIAKGMVQEDQKQTHLCTNTVIAGNCNEGRYNGRGNNSVAS